MKRAYLAAALLACAAACTTAPTTNTVNTNAANANTANANTNAAAGVNESDVIAREREVWDAIKRKDWAAFSNDLAEEFFEVAPEGVYDKAGTVAEVRKLDLTDVTLTDFRVVKIDNDAAVVAYTVSIKGSYDGKPLPPDAPAQRQGSAWVNRGGKWLAVYHQDTDVQTPHGPAGANTNTNANGNGNTNATTNTNTNAHGGASNANGNAGTASAANANGANSNSAAASPATTTADAEANERLVWDAIKRRDANAFGSFIAEDALEVEADQVYTREQSISAIGAQSFLSTAALSEFKTVTLDADAKVVTYRVKGTGPDRRPFDDRHSTIWANRAGRWVAVYHQGTTIRQGGM